MLKFLELLDVLQMKLRSLFITFQPVSGGGDVFVYLGHKFFPNYLHLFLLDLALPDENVQEEEEKNDVLFLGLESVRSDESFLKFGADGSREAVPDDSQ